MEMGMAETKKDITAYPLAGWSTYAVRGKAVLFEAKLLANTPEGEEVAQSLPLQMTAAQARAVAQDLVTAAEAAEMGQAPTPTRN